MHYNVLNVRYSAIHKDAIFVEARRDSDSNAIERLIENKKTIIFSMNHTVHRSESALTRGICIFFLSFPESKWYRLSH